MRRVHVSLFGAAMVSSTGATPAPAPNWTLRRAKLEDLPVLHRVINRAFEHEAWLLPGPRIGVDELAREIADPNAQFLVADLEGATLGTVRVQLRRAEESWLPSLGLLAVEPAAQRLGLGLALVRAAEAVAERAGFDALYLQCGRELGMEAYYAARGYELVTAEFGVRLGSFFPFTFVTMRKRLGNERVGQVAHAHAHPGTSCASRTSRSERSAGK